MIKSLSERIEDIRTAEADLKHTEDINRSVNLSFVDITNTYGSLTPEIAEQKYNEIKEQIGPVVNISDVNKLAGNYIAACQYGFSNLAKEMHPHINNALFGPLPDNYKQIILDAKNQGDEMIKTQNEMFYQKEMEDKGILEPVANDFAR